MPVFYFIVPVVSALLLLALLGAAWFPSQAGADTQSEALPAQIEPATRAMRRCQLCGTIVSKREVPRNAEEPDTPQAYEYSLRMADDSISVFQESLLISWRIGERVMVIDGTAGSRKN